MLRNLSTIGVLVALFWLSMAQRGVAQEAVRELLAHETPKPKITKLPALIASTVAAYPAQAIAAGIEGSVDLLLTLSATGTVNEVRVVKGLGYGLDEEAVAAVKQFRFSPAEVDGKPASVQVKYRYNFVLEIAFTPQLPWWAIAEADALREPVLIGRVREQGTRVPIASTAIAVLEAGIEVQSDAQGRFRIGTLAPGIYTIVASAAEYRRETITATVRANEQTTIEFYLELLSSDQYVTIVRGERRKTTVSRVSLKKDQLSTVPGTFGDPVRVVENLPGLARVPYVGGALLVRGAAPSDSGVYLDGVAIPNLYHFLGGPSVINAQFLERIDFYPGNADSRYGRLLAGVIDVGTFNTFTKQLKGSVDLNLLNVGLFLNVPITQKVSVAGAVRRSFIDLFLPSILKAVKRPATTVVPVYYDYQFRVDLDLAGDDRAYLLAFGSDDKLKIASNEPDDDIALDLDTSVLFHRVMGQWLTHFSSNVSRFAPFVGLNDVNFTVGNSTVRIRSYVLGLREDLERRVNDRVRLRLGVDTDLRVSQFKAQIPIPVDYRNPGAPITGGGRGGSGNELTTETQEVDVKQTTGSIGLYFDGVFSLTPRIQLIPGIRADLMFYFGNVRAAIDPRVTLRYEAWRRGVLKAATGFYAKAPEPNFANDTFGNAKLQLERALQTSVGIEQRFIDALFLEVQFYYTKRFDLAVRTDEVRFDSGVPKPLNALNRGTGNSYGLELLVKHDVTRHFYGWLSYTLSRSTEVIEDGDPEVRFSFDQTHLLTLVASYRFGRGWEIGTRFRLASGRPDTPILGSVFDSDGGFYRAIRGESRSVSRPLFHQLDVRVEKTWLFDAWRLALYLDVQNVYNAENPEATVYDYRFLKSGPLRGLPLLPTIGVKGSF